MFGIRMSDSVAESLLLQNTQAEISGDGEYNVIFIHNFFSGTMMEMEINYYLYLINSQCMLEEVAEYHILSHIM